MEMSEVDAEKAYKDYLEAVKTRKEKYLEDLKKVYFNLKQGKKVIDVFAAMQKAGVNNLGEPRLAISTAGKNKVRFIKQAAGSGSFYNGEWAGYTGDIQLPSGSFPEWSRDEPTKYQKENNFVGSVSREKIETGVPIVPAHLLPLGKLESYYILWEVDDWEEILPPVKDPFLLKRLSMNLFVVLAEWDLTEIEQSVIRGFQ